MEHLFNWFHNLANQIENFIKPTFYVVWFTFIALISPIYPAFFALFGVWV